MTGYYEVKAKCGHVGRNHYVEKSFAVRAESGKEAAAKARYFGRVKHDHKDAIIYVEEIDEQTFFKIRKDNEKDPYLNCSNVQDQRRLCDLDLFEEKRGSEGSNDNRERNQKRRGLLFKEERKQKKYGALYSYLTDAESVA